MTLPSIYYHGTTRDVLHSIKQNGLRPELARAFNFITTGQLMHPELPDANSRTRDGDIFLAAEREIAEMFALFRSKYEMFPPSVLLLGSGEHRRTYIKQTGEFQRHGIHPAQPIVLELLVPEPLSTKFVPDELAAANLHAFRYHGVLPPSTINKVYPVPMEELYDPQTQAFREAHPLAHAA